MSDNIINLRQARKSRNRKVKEEKAAENRAAFGRSKQEKKRDKIIKDKRETLLDGAIIDTPETE